MWGCYNTVKPMKNKKYTPRHLQAMLHPDYDPDVAKITEKIKRYAKQLIGKRDILTKWANDIETPLYRAYINDNYKILEGLAHVQPPHHFAPPSYDRGLTGLLAKNDNRLKQTIKNILTKNVPAYTFDRNQRKANLIFRISQSIRWVCQALQRAKERHISAVIDGLNDDFETIVKTTVLIGANYSEYGLQSTWFQFNLIENGLKAMAQHDGFKPTWLLCVVNRPGHDLGQVSHFAPSFFKRLLNYDFVPVEQLYRTLNKRMKNRIPVRVERRLLELMENYLESARKTQLIL